MNWSWLQDILSEAPTPVLAVALVTLVLAAVQLAAWRRASQAVGPEDEERASEGQEGYVISAVLGLLALLLGFTFSLAVDRYEIRRALVLQEANALGEAYLRSQLLPEPHRGRMSALLTTYADNRLSLAKAGAHKNSELLARNDALVTEIWAETVAV